MIPAAGVQDQELPIAPKRAGVNHPTVAWSGNLRAGPGGDRKPFLSSTGPIGIAELADSSAVDWYSQVSMHVGKGHRRGKATRVAQGCEIGTCRVFLDRAAGIVCRAGGWIEVCFELLDQVLDAVDLMREVRRVLLLG